MRQQLWLATMFGLPVIWRVAVPALIASRQLLSQRPSHAQHFTDPFCEKEPTAAPGIFGLRRRALAPKKGAKETHVF
jgi:hypothetical protein